MDDFQIERMSREEKLRAMEELWTSLSRDESRLESPAWHGTVLAETAARYERGAEKPVDWADAKRELRSRTK